MSDLKPNDSRIRDLARDLYLAKMTAYELIPDWHLGDEAMEERRRHLWQIAEMCWRAAKVFVHYSDTPE